MSLTTLPVAEARDHLSRLVDEAQTYRERFQISRKGRPAAVLMSQDDYDSLIETLEILANPGLMADITQGTEDDQAGRVTHEGDLRALMDQWRQADA
jgi:prevent-host-death family protein